MADELKVIKQSIVNTYASKTGKKTEDIEQLMSNETWWTGDIAVENGFCDELMFEDSTTVVENSSKSLSIQCLLTFPCSRVFQPSY